MAGTVDAKSCEAYDVRSNCPWNAEIIVTTSSLKLMVAIGVSVTIIAIFIQVVSWRYEEGEAETMNQKLREYRERRKYQAKR